MYTLFEPIGDKWAKPGFYLQYFEVLNWGTFDKHPWTINLRGKTALLTGANGSGKTTLVDGLLTLLVQNVRRTYNQASSTTGKRERTEKSYIQGEYGSIFNEDSAGTKPKKLRDNPISILLACFRDEISEQSITLAQVLWMNDGSSDKFFIIADKELSIKNNFDKIESITEIKKRCKGETGIEIFPTFQTYSKEFRKRFGLQSEKAMDLFNQTVTLKDTGTLNDFVRNNMLDKTDIKTKINDLQKGYEDLTTCHHAIQKARKQLEILVPLAEDAQNYQKLEQEYTDLERYLQALPAYFAQEKIKLLIKELTKIEQDLTQTANSKKDCDRKLADLEKKYNDLEFAIRQDSVGNQIEKLTEKIGQQEKESQAKKIKAEQYNLLAEILNLSQYNDEDTFYQSRTQADTLKQRIEEHFDCIETERDQKNIDKSELNKQGTSLEEELKSLRQRKNQIPKNNLEIRDKIIKNLNLDKNELPFVGELLKVRPEAQEWEGAIERLLRNFGLSILVSNTHYQIVNNYVNKTNLGGRLVYYRVNPSYPNPVQRGLDSKRVPSKLEIKQDNKIFSQWILDRLTQQFNYICCDSPEDFNHQSNQAITKNGLIKHSQERHEKNDQFKIDERSQYILGWDNIQKIKSLEEQLKVIQEKIAQINTEIKNLENQRNQLNKQKNALRDFIQFTDFHTIDWKVVEKDLEQLRQEKQQLEDSSDHLKEMRSKQEEINKDIKKSKHEQERLIRKIQNLEDNKGSYEKAKSICKCQINSVDENVIIKSANYLANLVQKEQSIFQLENIDVLKEKIKRHLEEKLTKSIKSQGSYKNNILRKIDNFRRDFAEDVIEIGSGDLEFLPEYLKLKEQIEKDDLPRNEVRFKSLMEENIIINFSIFKDYLTTQETKIKDNIYKINQSLQQIPYTDSTYIKLCYRPNYDQEIKEFKQDLQNCLGKAVDSSVEDNEKRFENIEKLLINRFKDDNERWTNKVTDVRNWLDFSVSERYRDNDEEKEHHKDSSGKSGGQKVKLAYTILASSIAYQFGLYQDNTNSKCFRFVVIDEAFSKSDKKNSDYAMKLFKTLNLQLLVITPNDNINLVEPYISTVHFVYNNSEGSFSKIHSLTIEEYQQNRNNQLND